LCAELGWQAGDTIEWTNNKDGTWTIQKKLEQLAQATT
jgi:plastocyanin